MSTRYTSNRIIHEGYAVSFDVCMDGGAVK
jgi:hypothetical protein